MLKNKFLLVKNVVFILIFLYSLEACSQHTYYVKNDGNDNNSGLSDSLAWATISKLKSINLIPGDSVLFKRGSRWVSTGGEVYIINNSGTFTKPIYFGAYGKGGKPTFSGNRPLQNWDVENNWTNIGGDVWTLSLSYNPGRLWCDSIEQKKAQTTSVNSDETWHWRSNVLYLNCTTNPAIKYNSIIGRYSSYCFTSANGSSDFIIIENLDLEGGDIALFLNNVKGWTVKNCAIGKNSVIHGIYGNGSDIEISFNIVDSYDRLFDTWEHNNSEDGIHISDPSDNWNIFNNTIKDWSHGSFTLLTSHDQYITNISFHDNFITAPDIDYGEAFLYNVKGSGNIGNKFYNNTWYQMKTGGQISGSHLEFYCNVIDGCNGTSYRAGGWGYGIDMSDYFGDPDNCKIYNNVFVNNQSQGIRINNGVNNNLIRNNIFYNNYEANKYQITINIGADNNFYENNLFFSTETQKVIFYEIIPNNANDVLTIKEFNELNGVYNDSIQNNLQADPLFKDLNLRDYHLRPNSPAIKAGLPVWFEADHDNILWIDPSHPNIGAFSSGEIEKPSSTSSSIKIDNIFPVPAQNFIEISLQEPLAGPSTLRIISLSGNLLLEKILDSKTLAINIPLIISSGIYIVQIFDSKYNMDAKLFVVSR